jgi:isoquinoline 1-oxidoreductase subunit alpha
MSTGDMNLNVNNQIYAVQVDPQKPLLWILREELGLCGTKYGCGIGACGACTVLLDGQAVRACQIIAAEIGDRKIVTIEGLDDELGKALKEAWYQERVVQCGYCQPGQIVSAYALLLKKRNPSQQDIKDHMTNLCRCGTYQRIRSAIAAVSSHPSPAAEAGQ